MCIFQNVIPEKSEVENEPDHHFFYTVGYSWDKGRQKFNREELYGIIEIRFSNPECAKRTSVYELSGKHDVTGDYTRVAIFQGYCLQAFEEPL